MGPERLFLHGFTGCPENAGALGPDTMIGGTLAPALSGHGSPPSALEPSFAGEVQRLGRWLDERISEPVQLVGYSLGARLGLGLLLDGPWRFSSALLIGVNPGLQSDSDRQIRRDADARFIDLLLHQGVAAFVERWEALPMFSTQSELPREILDAQRRCRLSHSASGLAHALRTLGLAEMPDFWSTLGALDLPILLVVGERDEKFRRIAESMLNSMPRARLEIARGAGHNVLLECPSLVQRLVREGC